MTHAELHLAVREALRGSTYRGFLVCVESAELHPGRIEVEYRISISGEGGPYLRGRDPFQLLARLRAHLESEATARAAKEPPLPAELAAIGAPPVVIDSEFEEVGE